jgi:hypothetical protein
MSHKINNNNSATTINYNTETINSKAANKNEMSEAAER